MRLFRVRNSWKVASLPAHALGQSAVENRRPWGGSIEDAEGMLNTIMLLSALMLSFAVSLTTQTFSHQDLIDADTRMVKYCKAMVGVYSTFVPGQAFFARQRNVTEFEQYMANDEVPMYQFKKTFFGNPGTLLRTVLSRRSSRLAACSAPSSSRLAWFSQQCATVACVTRLHARATHSSAYGSWPSAPLC